MNIQELKTLLQHPRTKLMPPAGTNIYEVPISTSLETNITAKYLWIIPILDLNLDSGSGDHGTVTAPFTELGASVKLHRFSNADIGYFGVCSTKQGSQPTISRIKVFGNIGLVFQSGWTWTYGLPTGQISRYFFGSSPSFTLFSTPSNLFPTIKLELEPNPITFTNFLAVIIEFAKPEPKYFLPMGMESHLSPLRTISKMYSDKELADLKVFVYSGDGQFVKIMAHKAVLAARSPVLKTMFEVDMTEKGYSKLKIVDFEPEIIEELLQYLYVGKIKLDCQDIVLDLLRCADKYDIQELLEICQKCIVRNVEKYGWFIIFELFDIYEERIPILKEELKQFYKMNEATLRKSPDFVAAIKKYPQHFVYLFI